MTSPTQYDDAVHSLGLLNAQVAPSTAPEATASEVQSFEGPEKLLELWFADAEDSSEIRGRGLLDVDRATWETMLAEVRCQVLSVIQDRNIDAYLLSESSFFVSPHKLILKTCGTTTLLLGLPSILRIAKEIAGFERGAQRCFYSRKTFMFPERQKGPHRSWTAETSYLDEVFGEGAAYTVGKINGDHWLLYIISPEPDSTPERPLRPALPAPPDHTLEIVRS